MPGLFDDLIEEYGAPAPTSASASDVDIAPLPREARALLRTIHGSESAYPGRDPYRVMYGGKEIDDFSDHPRKYMPIVSGPNRGNVTSAAGGYQFLGRSWDEAANALGLPDFSPENQDRAAFWHAENTYRRKTGGRDLISDIGAAKDDPVKLDQIGRALSGWWTSLPGGIEPNPATRSFSARFSRQLAYADEEGDATDPALYSMAGGPRDDRVQPATGGLSKSIAQLSQPRPPGASTNTQKSSGLFDDLIEEYGRPQAAGQTKSASPGLFDDLIEEYGAPETRGILSTAGEYVTEGLKGFAAGAKGLAAGALKGYGVAAPVLAERQLEAMDAAEAPPDMEDPFTRAAYRQRRAVSNPSEAVRTERRAAIEQRATTHVAEQPLYRAGQAIEEYGKETLAPAPGFEGSWTRDIGSGFGSMGAGMGLAMIPGAGPAVAATTFLGAGMGEAADRAIGSGATEEQIRRAAELGSVAGATDVLDILLPSLGTTGKAMGFLARVGSRAVLGAAAEGGQEAVQQLIQNAIAQGVYKPDQDILEDVPRSAAIGAITGGVAGGGFSALEGRAQPTVGTQPAVEGQTQPSAGAQPTVGADIPAGAVPAETLLPAAPTQGVTVDDRQVQQGLPSEIGVRQEPIQAGAVEGTGAEAAQAGGILQTPGPEPTQTSADAIGANVAPPVAPAEPVQPLPGRPVPSPSLQEILDDPRSADEIRADMEAAHNWQPSKDWQAVPRGVQLDPALETKTDGDVTFARLPPTPGTKAAPVVLETPQDVHVGAEITRSDPTPGQIEAGNYQKRHLKFLGRDISIETEQGATRTAKDGSWSVPNMPAPYGQILGTKGADGDPLDITIGPNPKAKQGFIIDQINPDTGKFDELKTFGGFNSEAEARAAYVASFSDGKGEARIGAVTAMPVAQFRAWLKGGNHKKALAYTPPVAVKQKTYRAKGPLNLLQFIAAEGGLSPDPGGELKYMGLTGKEGRIIVPGLGFRNLVRPGGMTLDRAWARAVEAGYINDPGYGSTSEPLQTTNVDLLRLISEGTGGRHTYAVGDEAAAAAIEASRAQQVEQERLAGARSDVQAALKEHGLIATDEQIDRAARLILTDESDPLNAIDHVIESDALADVDEAAQYQPQEQDDGIAETFEQRTGTTGGPVAQAVEQQARPRQAQDEAPAQRDQPAEDQRSRGKEAAREVADGGAKSLEQAKSDQTNKAIDNNGNPLVVYHGTIENFERFSSEKMGDATGSPSAKEAFFFASNPDVAIGYGKDYDPYENNIFIRFVNRLSRENYRKFNNRMLRVLGMRPLEVKNGKVIAATLDVRNPLVVDMGGKRERDESYFDLIKRAKNAGNDGVLFKNTFDPGFTDESDQLTDVWAVFNPDQINIINRVETGKLISLKRGGETKPVATEPGVEGRPQFVIPGAERIGHGEQAQRAADKPLRPKVAQKSADEGLFGDESKQTDLMDLARKPPPPPAPAQEPQAQKRSPAPPAETSKTEQPQSPETGPSDLGAQATPPAAPTPAQVRESDLAQMRPGETAAVAKPQAPSPGPSDSGVQETKKTDKGVELASFGRATEQFLTPRARRDRTKIEAELRRIIKQMTGRDVRVEFSPGSTVATQQRPVGYGSIDKGQQPRALYLPLDRLIKIALGVRDPRSSAYHEAWHYIEFHLLNDNEIGVLRAQTEKLRNVVQKRFGYTDKEIAEFAGYEVRAHAFETYARARERGETISGLHTTTRIFEKLRRLFERVRSALNGMGFKTIDDIFAKAFDGEYAGRPDLGTVDVEYLAAMREQREEDAVKFARKQNMGTPEGRKQAMQGYIARGQPLDRAIRLPFDLFGKFNEKGEWKPGAKLSEKAASIIVNAKVSPTSRFSFLNPVLEAARAGLIDRYSLRNHPDYIARERGRSLDERGRLLKVEPLIKSMMETVTDTNEAQVLHAILTGEAPPQEAWSKLAEPIRAAIDLIGQEAVELGQVSPESFERNRGTYVHRVYKNREAEQNGLYRMVSNMMGSRRKKIIGSQMKGRGMFHELSVSRLMRDVPGWNEAARGKPQNGEKFIRLDELAEQAEMELGGEPPPPKIQRTIWWPAERPIPDRYSSFKNQGTWEVRGEKGGNPVLWRDFTKAEREKMGEILDARYTVTKSLMLAAHDLATGRFYKDIAENENWSVSQKPSGNVITAGEWREQHLRWKTWKSPDVDWVQVPNDEISNTGGKKKWGALAGKYVREEIWRDLNEIDTLSRPSTWRTLLTFWKGAKTYMSPGVHMNNVMSNVFWFDFADGRLQDFVAGIQSYRTGDKYYQEALENGAFGSDIISQEMRDTVLKPVLEQIMRENTFQQAGGRLGAVGQISKFSSLLWSKVIARGNEFAKSAYQMEDEIFRMGLYLRRRQQGASPREAADDVRRQFIDYDIRAPWVNAARNSVLPFISYTYRAAPLIAHGIATRPWKLFKYMALFTVANALSYALTGGDEEKERKALRDEEQGMTWLLTPRMVRMPFLGGRDGKQPVFLDMRRWIPGGDIFDLTQTHAALPILPSWLTPGGPIMIGAEFLLNHQAFTGQDIVNERTDDLATKAEKTANWAWKALIPNAPWVPNSYGWENIATTLRGGDNSHTLGTAAASSVGVKLKPLDVEDALTKKQGAIAGEAGAIKREVARLTRLKERGKISENEHRRLTTRLILRATRTQEKAQELSR